MKRRKLTSASFLGPEGRRPMHVDDVHFSPGLRVAATSEDAGWIGPRLSPIQHGKGVRVGAVIPAGFDRYVRVLHPAAGGLDQSDDVPWKEVARWSGSIVHPEMQWHAIAAPTPASTEPRPWTQEPPVGQPPLNIRKRLASLLVEEADEAEPCRVAVWVGWGGFEPDLTVPEACRMTLPGREYCLFRASLSTLAEPLIVCPVGELAGPSLWWPADRSWMVVTEVDHCWTYVGGTSEQISKILDDDALETLETRLDHRADYQSDTLNHASA